MHTDDNIDTVDNDALRSGCAQRYVKNGTVLGDVDPIATEHRCDVIAQSALFGQRDKESQSFRSDAILRQVGVESDRFDCETLCAL